MASEWLKTTIGEQVTLQRGIDITKETQRPGHVPVVSSGGISSYHDTAAVSGPGVVLGRKGVVGSVFYVESDYWPHDTTLWVKDFHGNDPRFVYYFFRWFAPELATMDVGSANPTLNRNHVHPIKVSWPPVSEQRRIAGILGALDDKIELNRRMSQTLESMARALFKSWFVDFDPVRAKAEGRDPGLSGSLGALFPDSFEKGEGGETPVGWRPGSLANLADLNPESWSTRSRPARIDYVDLTNTKWGRIEAVAAYSGESAPSRARRVLRMGDTIVGTVRPGNGAYALTSDDGLTGSTGFAVLRPKRPEFRGYVYLCATATVNIEELAHLADGAAYPAIEPERVLMTATVCPPDPVMTGFARIVEPLLDRMAVTDREGLTLAAARDQLLPGLLSGGLAMTGVDR